jgi:hypothetical protein
LGTGNTLYPSLVWGIAISDFIRKGASSREKGMRGESESESIEPVGGSEDSIWIYAYILVYTLIRYFDTEDGRIRNLIRALSSAGGMPSIP